MSPAAPAELVERAQAGKRLEFAGTPPSKELAERMLEIPTGLVVGAAGRNAAVAALDLDAALTNVAHEWVGVRGTAIHFEHHRVGDGAPSVVIAPGLGDHTRRHLALAAALAERGFNVLGVDRQGHGLSEGHRGDAPLETDLAVLELALATARGRSSGPVILLGDSLGGIMTWYLLTREPDVDAAICHCISHPDVHPDPSYRFKAPLLRAVGRVAPKAPISVRQIADYGHVALDPVTKRYFDDEVDRLFNFTVTARSAASYLGFRPAIAWERVTTPVLVVIGAEDRMVTPAFTRESYERATPPRAEYLEVADAGHQLFLDHLGAALDPLVEWARAAISEPAGSTVEE